MLCLYGRRGVDFLSVVAGLWLLLAAPGLAQGAGAGPAYFRVTGVASNDVLNIRREASASSPIVGSFRPGAGPIEVLRVKRNWGLVSTGEQMGWVKMTFLAPVPVARFANSPLPEGLSCGGTEPFWGIYLNQGQVVYSTPEGVDENFTVVASGGFSGRGGPDGFFVANGSQSQLTGIVSARQCGDGMSERTYGWWVNLLLTDINGTNAFTGCCSLPVR